MTELKCNTSSPPFGAVLVAELLKESSNDINIEWGSESTVKIAGGASKKYKNSFEVMRILLQRYPNVLNTDKCVLSKTLIDHWLTFAQTLKCELVNAVSYLDKILGPFMYLAGSTLTVADVAVFSELYSLPQLENLLQTTPAKNVQRWMKLIKSQPTIARTIDNLPPAVKSAISSTKMRTSPVAEVGPGGRLQEGKFVELPFAEMGKVVVRFPPEASGYLHIGHAKAALLNQYYQEAFNGKLIMRFDDTNPAKENVEFEKVILEDVELLELKPDMFTHTSQYFELMLELCEKLIKEGKAFVDDTPAEQMKTEREQKQDSSNRNNSVEKNLSLWSEMKKASEVGIKCCIRAKIDMQSANGCMRDPTIYRCKPEPHPRTGTQYKVYPTYDFACPIVDSIEGVTHVLRTMEYHDRDPQFYWFIEALGLRRPHIWEYSRLSMTNTVLSKRKLTWFVEQGLVDGWDDPRMPTVRGVLRRGMTVEGLRQFIRAQGSSRSVVFMEWDKIWAINKKVIDPIAPRYTALELKPDPVPVCLKGVTSSSVISVPLHPKNKDMGTKSVWLSPKVLVDQVDAQAFKEGENVTFINYGNVKINKITKGGDGNITRIEGTPDLDNNDYKKTLKVTWLADTEEAKFTNTYCVFFEHIISKALLGKDEDFKQFIGHETRTEIPMLGDPELSKLKVGDIIQLQRRGFFRVDVAAAPASATTGRDQPCILFHIPDGHTKDQPGQAKPATKDKIAAPAAKDKSPAKTSSTTSNADALNLDIVKQGDLIRTLKGAKAEKAKIQAEVAALLALKEKYKSATGKDWSPNAVATASTPAAPAASTVSAKETADVATVLNNIKLQGDKIRKLKGEKADGVVVKAEVAQLLALKSQYKSLTGTEWTPNTKPPAVTSTPAEAVSAAGDSPENLNTKIREQGDRVRALKEAKAAKAEVQKEVQTLLSLKTSFKSLTGMDWTPTTEVKASVGAVSSAKGSSADTSAKITEQGDIIRLLKEQKSDKKTLEPEIQKLLALKKQYKEETGQEWKPQAVAPVVSKAPAAGHGTNLQQQIEERKKLLLKLKQSMESEQKDLEKLEAEYKKSAGDISQQTKAAIQSNGVHAASSEKDRLNEQISQQGIKVRDLKAKKVDKSEIDKEVKILLDLKAKFTAVTGTAHVPPAVAAKKEATPKKEKADSDKKAKKDKKPVVKEGSPEESQASGGLKKQTRLGLEAKKETDLPEWYSQVITKGEMIEYYDVSGCYILRPWSFGIWDVIREFIDKDIKKSGVKNCYFPIFVSKAVLEREKTHIADFAPEVAWVTHSGSSELAEHIAIRPTSETVMYPAYAKWVQSHRDLPLKLNQWNNVVRWEFKQPQPFIRTREFLWQEGHTAYANKKEADEEVLQILDLYARVYTDLLALPVVKGRKTEKEKFAGGDYTTTVEAYVPASGRAIQGATSHHLGQNFSKMFEIIYDDPETQEKKYVYQNSWGMTTRVIGVMILIHGDDRGLVLPPRVATVQVVVVPCGITASSTAEDRKKLMDSCIELEQTLKEAGIRVEGDYRDNYSPGWKFNHWELKGVPLRLELGPKDMAKGEAVVVRRYNGEKITIKRSSMVKDVKDLLEKTHNEMLQRATAERDARTTSTTDWKEFCSKLDEKHVILAPFCGQMSCEDTIKKESVKADDESGGATMGAKSLCIPFDQPRQLTDADKCIHPNCRAKPQFITLFGRSY